MTDLSEKQQEAVHKAYGWYYDFKQDPKAIAQVFQFTGYAGTGKTTAIKFLTERLGDLHIEYAAFTGKAARVISRVNEVDARTIHSLIYQYVQPDKVECAALYDQLHGDDPLPPGNERERIVKELEEASSPHFALNDQSDLHHTDLLILDEASMVNMEMLDDLKSFGVPILAIGDPGQLPPVKGAGALFIGEPDVKLEEIFRQAAENPIIQAVTNARKGIPWPYSLDDQADRRFVHKRFSSYTDETFKHTCLGADQVLVGMNKTRQDLNVRMRGWKGFDITNPYPQEGETLCCWKNDKERGLYNGDQCIVEKVGDVYEDFIELWVRLDWKSDGEPIRVRALRALFDQYYDNKSLERVQWFIRKPLNEFDFGYALTVHKAQGSQWDKVLFMDDGMLKGWRNKVIQRRQLVYTAGTRAAEKLIVYS